MEFTDDALGRTATLPVLDSPTTPDSLSGIVEADGVLYVLSPTCRASRRAACFYATPATLLGASLRGKLVDRSNGLLVSLAVTPTLSNSSIRVDVTYTFDMFALANDSSFSEFALEQSLPIDLTLSDNVVGLDGATSTSGQSGIRFLGGASSASTISPLVADARALALLVLVLVSSLR